MYFQGGRCAILLKGKKLREISELASLTDLFDSQSIKVANFCINIKWACETRALRARKTLMPRFTDFFADFEKKTDCFAVYSHIKTVIPARFL